MDSIVPPIPLDLDKRRHLRLDNRAMLKAERAMCDFWGRKQNLLSTLVDPQGLTLNDLAILLWASLLHEEPSLTLEQAQDLLAIEKLAAISAAVFAVWNAATAPAPGSALAPEDADGPFPANSTGAPSGVTPEAALA